MSRTDDKLLLCGRWFRSEEIDQIKEITQLFPNLSRMELALTVCEHLGWVAPNGKPKLDSCRQLFLKLEKQGASVLPPSKGAAKIVHGRVTPGAETDPEEPIEGPVGDLGGGIAVTPAQPDERKLWNAYVQRYHVLGYKRPFGAHERYFITLADDLTKRLGCMLFSASAWALAGRDEWIGWTKEDRAERLRLVINNSRFLILP